MIIYDPPSSPPHLTHWKPRRRQGPWWHISHRPARPVLRRGWPCTPAECDPTYLVARGAGAKLSFIWVHGGPLKGKVYKGKYDENGWWLGVPPFMETPIYVMVCDDLINGVCWHTWKIDISSVAAELISGWHTKQAQALLRNCWFWGFLTPNGMVENQ